MSETLPPITREGVVLQFEGAGERAKVQVNFSEGAKWLMVSYANLQILDT